MTNRVKSVYLTINPKGSHRSIFQKMFFNAAAYKEYVSTDEFKEKWPETEYDFVKETY